MVRRSFFSLLLFVTAAYGANHRTLTRQESREVAKKASRIIVNEESPIIELSLEQALVKQQNYRSTEMLEQREQVIDKISRLEHVDHAEENLKTELLQWAIKELAERNTHEVAQKYDERKKKWVAATIGLVSTIIGVVVPIVFSEKCDCTSDG